MPEPKYDDNLSKLLAQVESSKHKYINDTLKRLAKAARERLNKLAPPTSTPNK